MYAIIDFLINGIKSIVKILNVKMFPDFPVSYLQLICSVVVILALLKFIFGGMKEFDYVNDGFLFDSVSNVLKKMNNSRREKQILEEQNYSPKHGGIVGKHSSGYINRSSYEPRHNNFHYRNKHEHYERSEVVKKRSK